MFLNVNVIMIYGILYKFYLSSDSTKHTKKRGLFTF